MIVIPAIDIKDGRCVRLEQGRMSSETVYSDIPEEMAVRWHELGAERLHLVDLNGAVSGKPVNSRVIQNIVDAIPIPVQLGGGIRDSRTIEAYLDLGIHQVILGTVAYGDPDFVKSVCRRFPDRIILGIDARNGLVAVEGWTRETKLTPVEMAKTYEGYGVSAIIYTDISRDGMRTGPNTEATGELAKTISIPVIASGGISDIHDVAMVLRLAGSGVTGMITGKALYEGTLDLAEAIRLAKAKESGN